MMTVLFVECCVFSMEQKILLHNVGVLFIEDLKLVNSLLYLMPCLDCCLNRCLIVLAFFTVEENYVGVVFV